MFVEGWTMRDSRTHQPLTYDVRLPDEAQADALRLLDESKAVVNAALALLWPHLDEFATDRVGPAWKQVGQYIASPPRTAIANGAAKVKWWAECFVLK
jgi:putative transposase